MIKFDIVKSIEQTIARYLGGLREEISNVVELQPYWTYDEVCKLALKVEKQQKGAHGGMSHSLSKLESSLNQGNTSSPMPLTTMNSLDSNAKKTLSMLAFA